MIQRERFEEFQKTTYLGRILGTLLGADAMRLRAAEEALELAIYQTAYDPEQVRISLQAAKDVAHRQRSERLRDAATMDRVARYSEGLDDEDSAFPAARQSTKPPRPGITDAWKK